ncbi:hypothetical protein G6F22_013352 [Rhizopus arrhizus]|nr:hypothetical protein G6F22_013352 [Rhizopus arrhizus]KAG1244931.1 hypothetical protein G6F65_021530 [Rhizopus arrhizus]
MRSLPGLAQQRHVVVGQRTGAGARLGQRHHFQRAQVGRLGAGNARMHVIVAAVLVHQEADRAQLHAEHRLAQVPVPVQGLQHEAITAQRAQHVGLLGRVVAIARDHRRAGHLRRFGGAGQESDAGGVAHRWIRGRHEGEHNRAPGVGPRWADDRPVRRDTP